MNHLFELFLKLVDLFLNLDAHLHELIIYYGIYTYIILFIIIFAETGFVFTPFLPGDSLLFAAGTFAATGAFDIRLLIILLTIAAILGDTVNYWIGNRIGPKIFQKESRFIKKEYLQKTHNFYEKHGGKTIIIARFIPIIRTFAPFVAGIGTMTYSKFILYNIVGGAVWVLLFVLGGYFFGNIPLVKDNFSITIIAIIFISILPGIIEYVRHRKRKLLTESSEK
ncbi:MAG: DedA family protein [Ignavibacteriota bacterium]|nr:DedA family protein [Ignavibacteriales bacterium]MBL1123954.1 DedA family protein [Ignavibacteriota bacterium]MCE7857940.1 DedA family protein [Ignavibacteria bacterium CHB3]MEB2295297.1 DedA family protein [Ignavibacteria bacterium]QKJ97820.1 MAG: DedA family protein [Ignavibacteriota bacterium]